MLMGCVSATITQYDNIDKSKNISVSRTQSTLSSSLINTLYANDYDVFIKNKNTDVGYVTIKSNYELLVDANAYDICFVGGNAYVFSLSIVDLANSKEVFNYSGRGCHDTIVKNFTKLINNEQPEEDSATEILDLRK